MVLTGAELLGAAGTGRRVPPGDARSRDAYDGCVLETPEGDTWLGLSGEPLPVDEISRWAVSPRCGAVVVFDGTARDHAPGREGVDLLEYEAYEEHVVPRLAAIAAEIRVRWPDVGRIALVHRVGPVAVGESAVVVAVSAPHRGAAFDACRFGIDTLKATVPIWKRERWRDGESWGLEAQHLVDVGDLDPGGS